MAPMTLRRPGSAAEQGPQVVGNDGLTDAEREEYARRYAEGAGRRQMSEQEKRDLAEFVRARRG